MASIPQDVFSLTAGTIMNHATGQTGGVLQKQAAVLAFDQGGTTTCSSSPTLGQGVEGQAVLDTEGVEVNQEPNRVTATVLTHEADFDAIAGEWDELVSASCQHGVFFLRWHWNRVWWRMYAPPHSELLLIACRDRSGQLVGLAPLYRHGRSVKGLFTVQEICFIGTGTKLKTSEHLDIIARSGYQHLVGQEVAACIQQHPGWERVWLWGIHANSPVLPHFTKAFGDTATALPCDRLPYVATRADWATVKLGFGSNLRTNIDRYIRRIQKDYKCQFSRVRTPEQLEEFMDAFVQLHQERWQSKGEPGSFAYPNFKEFMQETVRDSFRCGRARLWMLFLDGQCVAALQAFVDRGVAHYFQGGFKSGFEKHHLGSVMLALSLQDCLQADGVDEFDYMGGGAAYKDHWTKTSHEAIEFEVLRTGFRPKLYAAIRYVMYLYMRNIPQKVRKKIRKALGPLAPSGL
jgi:CelD/BcsL family acetyltransferase involved in cellulose biosynthesis